ncbi:related to 15-hydroxyprostaglandin dehydrogenase [Cephalotrichum gorgonifer]|uniref:Related to 15-hydroxyprostaglandin dehydrogenase n=1 Tax=Cephalotrichum gorgonifer TaxID=2041049 RepID=A0AAE8N0X8_9PEZI|nr:related to 15-hydroxyprostaglandin dehydrogenase [Cephalotrichum gorgonifer]
MATQATIAVPFSVSGKTAIVTGAGSGINLAFAELLLSRNCNVVFADLSLRPEAKEVLSRYETRDSKSPRAVFVETDVTSWSALACMFDVALSEFGGCDVVCPGAGVYEPPWSSFWRPPGAEGSNDTIDAGHYTLLDINLTHPIRVTQMAISHWLHLADPAAAKASPSNPKRIIHIASVASQVPVFRAPLYGASKAAISGFVRSIGPMDEYCIRVCAVAPGLVRTPLWTDNPDKMGNIDETKDAWVTPLEVAEAMLDCVESENKVGGTVIEVGAGHTREVTVYNDPGPDRTPQGGLLASNGDFGDAEVKALLQDRTVWGQHSR